MEKRLRELFRPQFWCQEVEACAMGLSAIHRISRLWLQSLQNMIPGNTAGHQQAANPTKYHTLCMNKCCSTNSMFLSLWAMYSATHEHSAKLRTVLVFPDYNFMWCSAVFTGNQVEWAFSFSMSFFCLSTAHMPLWVVLWYRETLHCWDVETAVDDVQPVCVTWYKVSYV